MSSRESLCEYIPPEETLGQNNPEWPIIPYLGKRALSWLEVAGVDESGRPLEIEPTDEQLGEVDGN